MYYHMRWRHINTCCSFMCAYHAYVTIRRTLGVTCFGSRHFVNKVSDPQGQGNTFWQKTNPADTRHKNNIIMMSTWRRFDVMMALLLRRMSVGNKIEVVEFYFQHLPVHSRGVIWKIKSKSNFPVSFNLISAEMNLVGNYRTLGGLRTVNPEGLRQLVFDKPSPQQTQICHTLSEKKNQHKITAKCFV